MEYSTPTEVRALNVLKMDNKYAKEVAQNGV